MPFIGGAIAGAGSLLGGLFGANAASSASKAQVQASQNAINAELGVAGTIQQQLQPFTSTGTNALASLAGLLGLANTPGVPTGALNQQPQLNYDLAALKGQGIPGLSIPDPSNPGTIGQFQQSPGYQYALQQSSDAIQNSADAKTGALSGNMLRALQQNATGLANQDYYNWLNSATNFGLNNYNAYNQQYWNIENLQRGTQLDQYNAGQQNQNNIFNRLLALTQLGQNAAANLGSAQTQLGGNIGQAQIGIGNAIAGGQIGGTQALTNGINNALFNPYVQNSFSQMFAPNSNSSLAYLFGQGGGYNNPVPGYSGSYQDLLNAPSY